MARRKLRTKAKGKAKAGKAAPAPAKTTSALVAIREVTQSCVVRTDGQVVALVEVDGVSGFDLLHEQEKDHILSIFKSALYVLSFPIQIVLMPEPVDLSPEVVRLASPTGDKFLDSVGRDFSEMVRQHTAHLERVTYLIAIPATSIALARERAQTLIAALSPVHPDLRPGFIDTDRIVSLLSQAYGVPLPGPARVYVRAIDKLWNGTLLPPKAKDKDAS